MARKWTPEQRAAASAAAKARTIKEPESPSTWKLSPTGVPAPKPDNSKVYTVESGLSWDSLQLNYVFATPSLAQRFVLEEWPGAEVEDRADTLAAFTDGKVKIGVYMVDVRGEM